MEYNQLLMIVLAFILGCMCSSILKKMCKGRILEGYERCTPDGRYNFSDKSKCSGKKVKMNV